MIGPLPALIKPAVGVLTPLPGGALIPFLIGDAGEQASWRYVEFFTANIRNPNTRRAYARACGHFLAWCEARGLTLPTIRPYDVASYIEAMQQSHTEPTVKQQLAAVRMLFDWLITGQVVPHNPASAVRGPKHVVNTGKTPVLEGDEWRWLLDAIPTDVIGPTRRRPIAFSPMTGSARRIFWPDIFNRPASALAPPTAW